MNGQLKMEGDQRETRVMTYIQAGPAKKPNFRQNDITSDILRFKRQWKYRCNQKIKQNTALYLISCLQSLSQMKVVWSTVGAAHWVWNKFPCGAIRFFWILVAPHCYTCGTHQAHTLNHGWELAVHAALGEYLRPYYSPWQETQQVSVRDDIYRAEIEESTCAFAMV